MNRPVLLLAVGLLGAVPLLSAAPGGKKMVLEGVDRYRVCEAMFEAVRRLCGAESRISVVAACVGFLAVLLALSPGAHVTASVGIAFEAICCVCAVVVLWRGADYLARDARWSLTAAMAAALLVNLVRLSVLWAPGEAGLVPGLFDLIGLARKLSGTQPSTVVLPTKGAKKGSAAVLVLDQPGADAALAGFR